MVNIVTMLVASDDILNMKMTDSLNVCSGESPAAMQHGCSPGQLSSTALFIISVALTLMTNVKAQQTIWLSVCGVT